MENDSLTNVPDVPVPADAFHASIRDVRAGRREKESAYGGNDDRESPTAPAFPEISCWRKRSEDANDRLLAPDLTFIGERDLRREMVPCPICRTSEGFRIRSTHPQSEERRYEISCVGCGGHCTGDMLGISRTAASPVDIVFAWNVAASPDYRSLAR